MRAPSGAISATASASQEYNDGKSVIGGHIDEERLQNPQYQDGGWQSTHCLCNNALQ